MSLLQQRLDAAVDREQLRAIDAALADWCLRHGASPAVALGMCLASQAVGDGHACLELPDQGPAVPGEQPFCSASAFLEALTQSELVGVPGDSRPLILDGGRLYLHRYWDYEHRLALRLRELLAQPPAELDVSPLLREGGLFDYGWIGEGDTNWQAVAAATALRHRFTVISGGPGTGKTYTVLRLIRLLMDTAGQRGERAPVIRLAAPTGKAAARMMESIQAGLADLQEAESMREQLPDKAATLHRLLGLRQGSTRPWYHRDNPLVADAVIVDEASMVDLPLMAKLADALPEHARLILLGDRYQLASVESGSVLAELCDGAGMNSFSAGQRKAFGPLLGELPSERSAPASPLSDHVVTLQTSHRFHAGSPIGRFAAAVNDGDVDGAMLSGEGEQRDVRLNLSTAPDLDALAEELAKAYAPLVESSAPEEALAVLDTIRLLTATRVGPGGVMAMNRRIHQLLALGHGFDPQRSWYHGRPIIILQNDYRAGLFNGDTGVCLRGEDGHLRVWFRAEEGVRQLLPTSVPQHETVFAMTVHKSQGSEFSHVHLLLPEADSPVLSRELVYTGITRARQQLTLHAPAPVLAAAIARRVTRNSALSERLRH
ncbi:MAG: exodeoxyribonuclease V subunit alpha [Ectothiorhodospiraceae bacterium]|nr:exodeoxyribonuclease V subunit alpha [Ectothiorhodospiraceae bacterium]MCH8502868.1 exodeoxyribonuclease V subunit alpha [Ectothiorhodospiraceae bacterium]